MNPTPWDELGQRWRELYEQQSELAKTWLDGQTKLAGTVATAGGSGAAGGTDEAAAMGELWRSWLALGSSWTSMIPGTGEPGRVAGETLGRFLDPLSLALVGGSQVGETIRKLTEGPRFADLGAIERRMGRVMALWFEVQKSARLYEGVVAGAWAEANKRFMTELQERYRKGDAPNGSKAALQIWLEIANATLLEAHRSPPFLDAQAALLRHGMDFLLAEREIVEALVEPAGLPTRSEIDEVHRSVQDLKRRVRGLEKAARSQPNAVPKTTAAEPAPDAPARVAKPARRRSGAAA